MGFSHKYDVIDDDELKNESQYTVKEVDDDKDEHIYIPPTASRPWWKPVLYNVLAAGAGAGLMFLLTRGSTSASSVQSSTHPIANNASSNVASPLLSVDQISKVASDLDGLGSQILDCGWSVEEARAKGCIYDVMMQDWVPVPCYDSVLTEKYLTEGNWTWYADGEGKTTLSDEVMRRGEHGRAWMSTSYHKAHCVFSWMKIVRALRNNRGISQELLSYDHVMHCAHGALKGESDDRSLGVSAPTNYAKCALYDTWLANPIPDKHDSTQK